jgi:hypothetical protein
VAAKSKPANPQGKTKPVKIAATGKTKKPAKKAVRKPAAPKITDAMLEAYFLKRDAKEFKDLVTRWNEEKLRIRLTPQKDYDSWLNYFKSLPARKLQILSNTGMDILPTEAYTALLRWRDIIANPHRIDKIHQAGLSNESADKDKKSISQLALENDRLGVLKATRDKIAEKLDKGAGTRDTSLLAREMTEIMTQIADYEKRLGPKADTPLGALFADMPEQIKKRTKDGGARNTSFKSRITIDDLEDN